MLSVLQVTSIDRSALESAVIEASIGLQAVQDVAGLAEDPAVRVRFPRGYLRTSHQARQLFPFVRKPVLQTNLAYAVQLSDVYTWILTRTDIAGIARDMLVKAFLALAGGIAEALLIDYYMGAKGWRQTFATRVDHLRAEQEIESALQEELMWLWDMRCRQHIFELARTEFSVYEVDDHPRARAVVNGLIGALAAASGEGIAVRAV